MREEREVHVRESRTCVLVNQPAPIKMADNNWIDVGQPLLKPFFSRFIFKFNK